MTSPTYLAIDYGRAHLGLAFSDSSLATPLPSHSNNPQFFSSILSIISRYHITQLVIGLPSGPLEAEVRVFAAQLASHTSLPVTLHDETLTTHEAQAQLIASSARRSKRQNEHSYAAALILEDYLESVKINEVK